MAEVTKSCYTCKQDKPLSDYQKNKAKKDGLEHRCRACNNARIRAAYAKDPAKKIAATRQYHLDHPEWSKTVLREWHEQNAERRYQEYLERGKDPEVAAKRRDASRRSESRRRALMAGGTLVDHISSDDLDRVLVEYQGRCWICHVDLATVDLHWDHYKPLAKGGEHTLANLRPSCSDCNVRKNSIWPLTEERLDAIRRAVGILREPKEVM